jgi:uncharacterized protein with HEPN domain
MSRSDPLRVDDYLAHIVEAIDNICEYTADMDLVAFLLDKKTQDAVIRNFEVVGEACNNVTKHHPAFAAAHPGVPWSFAYEMRNALSHGYYKVDQQIVWRTISDDLPALRLALQAIRKIGS